MITPTNGILASNFSREENFESRPAPSRGDNFERFRVSASLKIHFQNALKNCSRFGHEGEQCHRGTQFEVVRKTHDLGGRFTVHLQKRLATLYESRTKDMMLQIRFGLVPRMNRIKHRHRTVSQTCDLGKNKPHPMRFLVTSTQFGERDGKCFTLCRQKAVQVERVVRIFSRSHLSAKK